MHVKIGCAAGALLLAQVATAQVLATGDRYAIQTANLAATLAEAGLPVGETRLHLPGPLSARTELPALKVTAAQQRANGSLEVRFACRKPADCMPFFVLVDAADDRAVLAAFAERTSRDTSAASRVGASPSAPA